MYVHGMGQPLPFPIPRPTLSEMFPSTSTLPIGSISSGIMAVSPMHERRTTRSPTHVGQVHKSFTRVPERDLDTQHRLQWHQGSQRVQMMQLLTIPMLIGALLYLWRGKDR